MNMNRSFMSGLGIGLIIGAVLLQLMIVGKSQVSQMKDQPDEDTVTREQIEEQAKTLDLKVVESSKPLLTEEEWKQLKLEESANMQGESIEAPVKSKTAVEPVEPSSPVKPTEKNSVKPTSKVKVPIAPSLVPVKKEPFEKVSYKINKGSSLTDVAEGLEQIDVISDRNLLIKEATKQKVNTKILEGNYTFFKGESYESIISKIRTQSSR
jgi:hypothetical protein